nr:immunoglobulin light chain junction region [Macaca mulatta]
CQQHYDSPPWTF